MRKKIEELRNREEGFTLVELLAIIVILGIIVAIAIPSVGTVIDRASSKATDAEQALVKDAARLYVTTNREKLEGSFGSGNWVDEEILIDDLYGEGYLEDRDGDGLTGVVIVNREAKPAGSGIYKYKYDASGVTKK